MPDRHRCRTVSNTAVVPKAKGFNAEWFFVAFLASQIGQKQRIFTTDTNDYNEEAAKGKLHGLMGASCGTSWNLLAVQPVAIE